MMLVPSVGQLRFIAIIILCWFTYGVNVLSDLFGVNVDSQFVIGHVTKQICCPTYPAKFGREWS